MKMQQNQHSKQCKFKSITLQKNQHSVQVRFPIMKLRQHIFLTMMVKNVLI